MNKDYNKLHETVLEYHSNKKLSMNIIQYFDNLLQSYINLIYDCKYNIQNTSTYYFINLFSKFNCRVRTKGTSKFKYNTAFINNINDTVHRIHDLYSHVPKEDIYNMLVIVLLEMARRYHDFKPSFHIYVQKFFHLNLLRYINYEATIVSNNNLIENDTYEYSDTYLNTLYNIRLAPVSVNKIHDIREEDYLDYNWCMGITCSDVFKQLSILERMIIINKYINKKCDDTIASRVGLNRVTINIKRNEAIKYLEQSCIEHNLFKKDDDNNDK